MGSKLFKQFIRKAIAKQGAPGPPPRRGLVWKPQTRRWIRPMIYDEKTGEKIRRETVYDQISRDTLAGGEDSYQRERRENPWGSHDLHWTQGSPTGERDASGQLSMVPKGPTGIYSRENSPLGYREKEIKDLFQANALDALLNGQIDVQGADVASDLIDEVFLNGDILGELGIVIPDDPDIENPANEHISDIISDATVEFMNRDEVRAQLTGDEESSEWGDRWDESADRWSPSNG